MAGGDRGGQEASSYALPGRPTPAPASHATVWPPAAAHPDGVALAVAQRVRNGARGRASGAGIALCGAAVAAGVVFLRAHTQLVLVPARSGALASVGYLKRDVAASGGGVSHRGGAATGGRRRDRPGGAVGQGGEATKGRAGPGRAGKDRGRAGGRRTDARLWCPVTSLQTTCLAHSRMQGGQALPLAGCTELNDLALAVQLHRRHLQQAGWAAAGQRTGMLQRSANQATCV